MSIKDVSLGYHNLQLDTKSSYLTTFMCPCGRYQYKYLPFGAVPVGDMFQSKTKETINDMSNVIGIADDILVIGYDKDGKDHNEAVYNMLRWCKDVNLKLMLCNPKFICKNNRYFGLSSTYFLYPLASLPKMVKQEMPASIEQS